MRPMAFVPSTGKPLTFPLASEQGGSSRLGGKPGSCCEAVLLQGLAVHF